MTSKRKDVTKDANIHLRITDDLKKAIAAAAMRADRSVSSWIVIKLREAVEREAGGSDGRRTPMAKA